jgi:ApbE superfamily uncharacterized protein (UPF0280 family)
MNCRRDKMKIQVGFMYGMKIVVDTECPPDSIYIKNDEIIGKDKIKLMDMVKRNPQFVTYCKNLWDEMSAV